VRSKRRRADLLSAWRDLNPQSPFPGDTPVWTGAVVLRVEKEKNTLMAWPCAQVVPLGRWRLRPVPRGLPAFRSWQAGSFREVLLLRHGQSCTMSEKVQLRA